MYIECTIHKKHQTSTFSLCRYAGLFGQSRYPMTDILSVLTVTDTDNRYFTKCQYIGSTEYIGSTDISVNRYAIPGGRTWLGRGMGAAGTRGAEGTMGEIGVTGVGGTGAMEAERARGAMTYGLHHAKRSLISWVVVIPKEGRATFKINVAGTMGKVWISFRTPSRPLCS